MRNKYRFVAVLLVGIALLDAGLIGFFRAGKKAAERQKIVAVTSFYPVYIAAANVVGDCGKITLKNLSEPQTGCLHDFQLTPEDMKLLSAADIFLINGGGMESFLGGVEEQYPDLTVAETSDGLLDEEDNAHVWMSIPRYRSQTAKIAELLCKAAPECEKELKENAAEYDRKLAGLQAQQEEIKKAAKGRSVVSFHEAYEYLAADYGFSILYGLNLDEERQVGAGEVADVLRAAKDGGADIIFAEELYGRDLAETVQKEADVFVYYLDTLVRGAYDKDSYLDGMQKNLDLLKEAFGV